MTEPATHTPGSTATAGSVIERFVARLLDGLLVGVPLGMVLSLLLGLLGIGDDTLGLAILSGTVAAANLGYFLHFESSSGQTIGKRVMGLRTTTLDGSALSFGIAARRNFWVALALFGGIPAVSTLTGFASLAAALSIGVTIVIDALGRGWHDKYAGTRVIRAG